MYADTLLPSHTDLSSKLKPNTSSPPSFKLIRTSPLPLLETSSFSPPTHLLPRSHAPAHPTSIESQPSKLQRNHPFWNTHLTPQTNNAQTTTATSTLSSLHKSSFRIKCTFCSLTRDHVLFSPFFPKSLCLYSNHTHWSTMTAMHF